MHRLSICTDSVLGDEVEKELSETGNVAGDLASFFTAVALSQARYARGWTHCYG